MYEQWKKAVVHLECATDSEHYYDRIKRIDQMREKLEQGEITQEEFGQEIADRTMDLRCHGTAVFISHNERRYLLTARHVLLDEISAKREYEEELARAKSWTEGTRQHIIQSANERASNKICNIVFCVPSLDDVLKQGAKAHREFLMNLGAGTSSSAPYTFSSPEMDIAIISLDQRDSHFADQLITLGYEPMLSEHISKSPSSEGADIFTVGFPSATAIIGQISQHPALAKWSSNHLSLPVFTFGKVSMLHAELPFYWCDMSIFPGNSGGPVIEAGRLVGIVSAQAVLPIDGVSNVSTRIPFGKINKTACVKDLLNIQEQKDRN